MVSQCKLLINCTGPYRLLGEGVLSACVKRIVCFLDLLKIHVRLYSTISLETTVTRLVTYDRALFKYSLNRFKWIETVLTLRQVKIIDQSWADANDVCLEVEHGLYKIESKLT